MRSRGQEALSQRLWGFKSPHYMFFDAKDHALFVWGPLVIGPKKHSGKAVGINESKTEEEYRALSYCQTTKSIDLLIWQAGQLQIGNTQGKASLVAQW